MTAETGGDAALRRRAVHGALTVVGRGFVVRALGLAGTLVLARLLFPADFGIIALGLALASMANTLSGAGLAAALIKQEAEPAPRQLATVLAFQLVVTGGLATACACVAALIGTEGAWAVALTVASAPAFAVRGPTAITLERRLAYRPLAVAEVVETVVYQLVAIGLVVAGAGVVGVAVASVVRASAGTAVLVAPRRETFVRPVLDRGVLRSLVPFGLLFQAPWAVEIARFNIFNALLSSLASLGALGLWSVGTRLIQPVQLIQAALERVAFAAASRAVGASRPGGAALDRMSAAVTLALGGGLVPLVLVSIEGVPALLGSEWAGAGEVLGWIGASQLLTASLHVVVFPWLYVSDRAGIVLRSSAVSAVFNVAAVAAAAPTIGLQGVGAAVALSALLQLVVTDRLLRADDDPRTVRAVGTPLVVTVLAGAAGAGVLIAVPGALTATVLAVLAGGGAFVLLALLLAPETVAFARRQLLGREQAAP